MMTTLHAPTQFVFIHGAMGDRHVWEEVGAVLTQAGVNWSCLELPGHGMSPGPALPSVQEMANWVRSQLPQANWARTVLVGHSMGALVALEAAAGMGGLVMIGVSWPMAVSDALLATAASTPEQALSLMDKFSRSRPWAGQGLPSALTSMQRQQQAYQAAGHGNLVLHDLSACHAYQGAPDAVAKVHCPVTMILGTKDKMTPPARAQMLIDSLHANVVMLEAGHAMMEETASEVASTLAHFQRLAP